MAMIFMDEAGHFSISDFVCLAGYLASDSGWDSLCQEWKPLLEKHGLPGIHMKEIMSPKGKSPAALWPMDKKLSMLTEFISVIRKHVQTGFGIGLDAHHYRDIVKCAEDSFKNLGMKSRPFKPPLFATARMARIISDYFDQIGSKEQVCLIFDDSEQYSMQCYSFLCELKSRNQEVRSRFVSITFADDSHFYPLLAADLLAYATCNELRKAEKGWSYLNIFTDLLNRSSSDKWS